MMETVFYSPEQLKEFLHKAPDGQFVTVTVEGAQGKGSGEQNETGTMDTERTPTGITADPEGTANGSMTGEM